MSGFSFDLGVSDTSFQNESRYHRYLASKDDAKQWMNLSLMQQDWWPFFDEYHPDCFACMDITSSGEIRQWKQGMQKDISTARGNLENGQADTTRLILFDHRYRLSAQELFGDLYDIDPAFFRDVAYSQMAMGDDLTDFEDPVLEHPFREYLTGHSPTHLHFGYGWVGKVIHCKETRNRKPRNVVIIFAGRRNLSRRLDFGFAQEHHLIHGNNPPGGYTEGLGIALTPSGINFREVYLKNIRHRGNTFCREAHDNPLLFMLPILEIHAAYLQNELTHADGCLRLGRTMQGPKSDLVERAWDTLRMMKHDGMGPLRCFQHYVEDHSDQVPQQTKGFEKVFKKLESIDAQIIRAEELARDYVQVQVGRLSLEESRASIKQSRVALEESKRTKLITVLAIIFVPISLSTSIFGMNINELNASGQSLWVFIVTTASILAATMVAWAIMYQFHKYNSLPDLPDDDPRRNHHSNIPVPGVIGRLQMISGCFIKLICGGHIFWTWKSGIIFSLITGGRKGFLRSCLNHWANQSDHDPHDPYTYVQAHVKVKKGFDCSSLEAMA